MPEKAHAVRPESTGQEPGKDQRGRLSPADINAEIARMKAAQQFMDKSGTLAISSKLQIAHVSVLKSLCDMGIDLHGVVSVYERFEQRSPNLSGIGRTQSIQILTAPQILIPGVGRMDDVYPEKPGLISRAIAFFTGGSATTQTGGQVQR